MDVDVTFPADQLSNWHFALGGPVGRCLFKSCCDDFLVNELLPFEPEGEGEHLFLLIEKTGENTDWVADILAKHAGVKRQSVSYAGRKDRYCIARQWFSVTLPGMADPDWSGIETNNIRIITQVRHRKKLKIGNLLANDFCITLRKVDAQRALVNERLEQISREGVPNYFGPQRFGIDGQNIQKALEMLAGKRQVRRNKRSIYLSAARSWLFNKILSEKVGQSIWNKYLPGDILGFPDSNSLIFDASDGERETVIEKNLLDRLKKGEVSTTSPLWGRGEPQVVDQALTLEKGIAEHYQQLCHGLELTGMKQERRVNRLIPQRLSWTWKDHEQEPLLVLHFRLPKGSFATSVLRELLQCVETTGKN